MIEFNKTAPQIVYGKSSSIFLIKTLVKIILNHHYIFVVFVLTELSNFNTHTIICELEVCVSIVLPIYEHIYTIFANAIGYTALYILHAICNHKLVISYTYRNWTGKPLKSALQRHNLVHL